MFTLNHIAEFLGRDRAFLLGLLKRFELPTFSGAEYPETYVSFLRVIVFIRLAQVSEAQILELWTLERKIMVLLHADSLGSATWMTDGHGQKGSAGSRLFLSRFDVGADLQSVAVQPGLEFSISDEELFAGSEMGEDVLRLLMEYRVQLPPILKAVAEQEGVLQAAGDWSGKIGKLLSRQCP